MTSFVKGVIGGFVYIPSTVYNFVVSTAPASPSPEGGQNSTNTTVETVINITQPIVENITHTFAENVTNVVENITKPIMDNVTATVNNMCFNDPFRVPEKEEEESSLSYKTVAFFVGSVGLVGWGAYKFYKKRTAPITKHKISNQVSPPPPPPLVQPPPPTPQPPPAPAPPPPPPSLDNFQFTRVELKGPSGLALADKLCDTVPVLSTVSNIINIIQKIFLSFCKEENLSGYYLHLKKKSWSRCFVCMIPGGFKIADRFKL